MGASFANDKDNYSLNKAYHYLLLAMELRFVYLSQFLAHAFACQSNHFAQIELTF